ncbi:hypothetical protein MBOU_10570 [Mycobacterium bourgelatii]|uniref:Uncharacterized protein n=1 Tax=Mycobacterium bourgelatii TaxID=1273442 RepID=A0A7I9YK01_MYCBU|nr:hypothetical protein MBOU_10570 [Mycobacterium bourgelatii]
MHTAHQRLADRRESATTAVRTQQLRRQCAARPCPQPTQAAKQQNRFGIDAVADVRDRGVDQQAALTGPRAAKDTHHAARARRQNGLRFRTPRE